MNKEKLTSDSLENARILIQTVISSAIKDRQSGPSFTLEDSEEIESIWNAWNLLCVFGDLDDNDGMFDEFAYQYNKNHGLE
jgi:hypothetical protein